MDDVLICLRLNRFFRKEVLSKVKRLIIRKSSNLRAAYSPTLLPLFLQVESVFVYSFLEETGYDHGQEFQEAVSSVLSNRERPMSMAEAFTQAKGERCGTDITRMDPRTLEQVIPFLASMSKSSKFLSYVYVGGMCRCEGEYHACWTRDDVRQDLQFDIDKSYNIPREETNRLYANFVYKICQLYSTGELSRNVLVTDIPIDQRCKYTHKPCIWRGSTSFPTYRDDIPCQLCDAICTFFPLHEVIHFRDDQVPCISLRNRLTIARARDPDEFGSEKLTKRLLEATECRCGYPVMMPPEFVHHELAAKYSQEDLEKMRLLISHGADPVHPGLRKLLVERPESKNEDDDDGDVCFGWTKRYHQRLMPDDVY